jgi:hypothetical protein
LAFKKESIGSEIHQLWGVFDGAFFGDQATFLGRTFKDQILILRSEGIGQGKFEWKIWGAHLNYSLFTSGLAS